MSRKNAAQEGSGSGHARTRPGGRRGAGASRLEVSLLKLARVNAMSENSVRDDQLE